MATSVIFISRKTETQLLEYSVFIFFKIFVEIESVNHLPWYAELLGHLKPLILHLGQMEN